MRRANVVLFLLLIVVYSTKSYQDPHHQNDSTCEIDGIIDQNLHQLHGDLVNCQGPEMECFIDPHEYLIKSRTIIDCRILSDDWFFHDDRTCLFRYYYHRSYCFHENRCYSISMTCLPVTNLTVLSWIILLAAIILVIATVSFIVYCSCKIYKKCCQGNKTEKKQSKDHQFPLAHQMELMKFLEPIENAPRANNYNPKRRMTETLI